MTITYRVMASIRVLAELFEVQPLLISTININRYEHTYNETIDGKTGTFSYVTLRRRLPLYLFHGDAQQQYRRYVRIT